MNYMSIGDMAQTFQLRRHNVQLKQTLSTLSEEMTTGIKSDLGRAVSGNFSMLSSIDRSLTRLESFEKTSSQAAIFASTLQSSLEDIQSKASSSGASLLTASSDIESSSFDAAVQSAASNFESIISVLNTKVAGRYIFSGEETTTQPMASSDVILSSLTSAVTGLTSSDEIISAIDDWFSDSSGLGGFLDVAYSGSLSVVSGARISETEAVEFPVTGASSEIRNVLKGFAISRLVADDTLSFNEEVKVDLIASAGKFLMSSDTEMSDLRGVIGAVEARVSDAQDSNSSEKTALELARLNLIGIDEYDTATALEAVQAQIETLYTLTAKLSGLTLTDYL